MKLFVKNLPFTTVAGELHKMFESYGKVTVELQRHQSGKSRGSAYLTFENEEAATRAMEKNGELLGGRVMKVMKARPPMSREDYDQERKRTRRRNNYGRKPRGDEICFGYPINQQRAQANAKTQQLRSQTSRRRNLLRISNKSAKSASEREDATTTVANLAETKFASDIQ